MACAINVAGEAWVEMSCLTASQETYVSPGHEIDGKQLTQPADWIVSAVRRLIRTFDPD